MGAPSKDTRARIPRQLVTKASEAAASSSGFSDRSLGPGRRDDFAPDHAGKGAVGDERRHDGAVDDEEKVGDRGPGQAPIRVQQQRVVGAPLAASRRARMLSR